MDRVKAAHRRPTRRWRQHRVTFSEVRQRRNYRPITGAMTPVRMSTSTTPRK